LEEKQSAKKALTMAMLTCNLPLIVIVKESKYRVIRNPLFTGREGVM